MEPNDASIVIMQWSAYEREHIERGSDWFWALGVIAVCAAIISILFHDLFFAILIIAAAGALATLAIHPPRETTFSISKKGIAINETMHRFSDIGAFWVEEEHHDGRPVLLLTTNKVLHPSIVIPIEHVEPVRVRALLSEYLTEEHMQEPKFHKILEFCGLA